MWPDVSVIMLLASSRFQSQHEFSQEFHQVFQAVSLLHDHKSYLNTFDPSETSTSFLAQIPTGRLSAHQFSYKTESSLPYISEPPNNSSYLEIILGKVEGKQRSVKDSIK